MSSTSGMAVLAATLLLLVAGCRDREPATSLLVERDPELGPPQPPALGNQITSLEQLFIPGDPAPAIPDRDPFVASLSAWPSTVSPPVPRLATQSRPRVPSDAHRLLGLAQRGDDWVALFSSGKIRSGDSVGDWIVVSVDHSGVLLRKGDRGRRLQIGEKLTP